MSCYLLNLTHLKLLSLLLKLYLISFIPDSHFIEYFYLTQNIPMSIVILIKVDNLCDNPCSLMEKT